MPSRFPPCSSQRVLVWPRHHLPPRGARAQYWEDTAARAPLRGSSRTRVGTGCEHGHMTMPQSSQRPTNPKLAKAFDQELSKGNEIRYADENQVVAYHKNQWGCGGIIFLIIIGLLTAFIVPIILFILGALQPGGQTITYTLKPNGKVKKQQRAAK